MFSRFLRPQWMAAATAATAVTAISAYTISSHTAVHAASASASTPTTSKSTTTSTPTPTPTPTPSTTPSDPDHLVCVPTVLPHQLELIQVTYLTRHGARTAFAYSPGMDKNSFSIEWGKCHQYDGKPENMVECGRAQLTPLGESQLRAAGEAFRRSYVQPDMESTSDAVTQPRIASHQTLMAQRSSSPTPSFLHTGFLSSQYNPDEILIRSTDILRTKMSLVRFMQGLYPGVSVRSIVSSIRTNPLPDEYLFPNPEKCPRLKQLTDDIFHGFPFHSYLRSAEVDHVRRLLSTMYSVDHVTLLDMPQFVIIADELWCRKEHGMSHILGSSDELVRRSHNIMTNFFQVECGAAYTHPFLRTLLPSHVTSTTRREHLTLATGPVIKEILGYMEDAVNAQDEKKEENITKDHPSYYRAILFGGHDSTLAPLLEAMNLYTYEWPKFGESVALELMKEKDAPPSLRSSYHVRILVNHHERALVSYDTLHRHLSKFIPYDYIEQCKRTDNQVVKAEDGDWALDG